MPKVTAYDSAATSSSGSEASGIRMKLPYPNRRSGQLIFDGVVIPRRVPLQVKIEPTSPSKPKPRKSWRGYVEEIIDDDTGDVQIVRPLADGQYEIVANAEMKFEREEEEEDTKPRIRKPNLRYGIEDKSHETAASTRKNRSGERVKLEEARETANYDSEATSTVRHPPRLRNPNLRYGIEDLTYERAVSTVAVGAKKESPLEDVGHKGEEVDELAMSDDDDDDGSVIPGTVSSQGTPSIGGEQPHREEQMISRPKASDMQEDNNSFDQEDLESQDDNASDFAEEDRPDDSSDEDFGPSSSNSKSKAAKSMPSKSNGRGKGRATVTPKKSKFARSGSADWKGEVEAHEENIQLVDIPGFEAKQQVSTRHLNQFFYWCAERQSITKKREMDLPPPWSKDILFSMKLGNVYRHQDANTQWVIKNVIDGYKPDGDHPPRADTLEECVWRVMVFWQFNKVATWEGLKKGLGGDIRWATYDEEEYSSILGEMANTYTGNKRYTLFTGSYQIHPDRSYGSKENYVNAIRHLANMMNNDVPLRLSKVNQLEHAVGIVINFPGMANYHSLQLVLNLNYTPFINLVTTDWICNGRGAKNGLCLIIPSLGKSETAQLLGMNWLMLQQDDHWRRLGTAPYCNYASVGFQPHLDRDLGEVDGQRITEYVHTPGKGLRGAGIDLTEIEQSLCLWQKYERAERKWREKEVQRADGLEVSEDEDSKAHVLMMGNWVPNPNRTRTVLPAKETRNLSR